MSDNADKAVVLLGLALCLGLVWFIDWQELVQAYIDALTYQMTRR